MVKEGEKLPQVSFRVVNDGNSASTGVHDQQARSYGYNDFKAFDRPDHYIRYVEPIESELATQVEYDMDEQDQEWLDSLNADRKKDQIDQVSYETFEIIMDRLEKEYFDLMKHVPKPDMALPSEDSTCSICDDGEAENSNAILFCDGCNLAVHQDCYGVPYIPEGQWLCRKCTISPENPVACVLCPNEGGAFKQTNKGQWAHLLCAIWVPEVSVGNQFIMEPIENIEAVPKSRWKLICSLCKDRRGACIQCDVKTCFSAFHVSCARKYKLLMAMKNLPGQEEPSLRAFCEKHLPKELKELRDAACPPPPIPSDPMPGSPTDDDDEDDSELHFESHIPPPPPPPSNGTGNLTKTARAHANKFSTGPPLVPQIIVDKIMNYIGKIHVRKKINFVLTVCKYWSLKREARRGAPLLKRLHLEPWTASALRRNQSDAEKRKKLDNLISLRKDLEKVRMLAELARKREQQKLKQAQIIQSFISSFFFPFGETLKEIFVEITNLDRNGVFTHPVSKAEAPDYYDVVKTPMTWMKMSEKLDCYGYLSIDEFKADVNLVLDNSMLYNPPTTTFYKTAAKIKAAIEPILAKLPYPPPPMASASPPDAATDSADTTMTMKAEDHDPMPKDARDASPPVHELEASIGTLNMLLSEDAITEGFPLLLGGTNPLDSLFSFELEKLKPRPPKSPTPPPPPSPPKEVPVSPIRADKKGRGKSRDHKADSKHKDDAEILTTDVASANPRAHVSKAARTAGDDEAPEDELEFAMKEETRTPASKRKGIKQGKGKEKEEAEVNQYIEAEPEPEDGEEHSLTVAPPIALVPTPSQVKPPKTTKKRKRPEVEEEDQAPPPAPLLQLPLGQSPSLPPVVQDVGNHDSFLLFNQGWVLPSGTKRGGRAPVDKTAITPLAKARAERKRSRLSVAATSASENQTLQPPPVDQEPPAAADDSQAQPEPAPVEAVEEHEEVIESKRESVSMDPIMEPVLEAPPDVKDQPSSPLSSAGDANDTSELSEPEEGQADDAKQSDKDSMTSRRRSTKRQLRSRGKKPPTDRGSVVSSTQAEDVTYEGGTLVWAKSESYPWFPAVVFEEDDEAVPESVLSSKEAVQAKSSEPGPMALVRFFDNSSSWGWMKNSKIKLLGEDKNIDAFLLNHQRFKTARIKALCRTAHKRAMAEMETPEDLANAKGAPRSG